MATLGERINRLRKQHGLTLDQLAEKAGSSKSYIWELENKNPPRPSAEKLSKIATHLEVTLDYLLEGERKVAEADSTDEMFFRKYQELDKSTKTKIRKMVELWKDE